jgi:aromatic-L-amino-acid/L-tryptophan decarboxylase
MAPRSLSVVCFRYVGGAPEGEERIAVANRAILERLQLAGDAFITSTELTGRFVLRACVVNYRSTRADVDRMLEAIRTIGRELAVTSA